MHKTSILFRLVLISLSLCHWLPVCALEFLPVLHNYGRGDYHAALQNWDLAQGNNGEMYIGNGEGVLCFDGYTWTLTQLPGGAVARSLLMLGDRLYVGTYQDFGYMERDEYGILQYTSLWPKGYAGHDDEIWNIVCDRHGIIYFCLCICTRWTVRSTCKCKKVTTIT